MRNKTYAASSFHPNNHTGYENVLVTNVTHYILVLSTHWQVDSLFKLLLNFIVIHNGLLAS